MISMNKYAVFSELLSPLGERCWYWGLGDKGHLQEYNAVFFVKIFNLS